MSKAKYAVMYYCPFDQLWELWVKTDDLSYARKQIVRCQEQEKTEVWLVELIAVVGKEADDEIS